MADSYSLSTNPDGSAVLSVTFDVSGIQCDPLLVNNLTNFALSPQLDGDNNIIPWTLPAAQASLAGDIAASKAAFLAAAPGWQGPTPTISRS